MYLNLVFDANYQFINSDYPEGGRIVEAECDQDSVILAPGNDIPLKYFRTSPAWKDFCKVRAEGAGEG